MRLVRTALIATAACLIGAAAYAQTTDSTSTAGDQATMPQTSMPQTSPDATPPADTQPMAPTGTSANTSVSVDGQTQVIASQPVPDTKANRAAYGQPLSRAGKRTATAGN